VRLRPVLIDLQAVNAEHVQREWYRVAFVVPACALLPRSSSRGATLRAFLAALISLFIVGGYALVFTGVIRLR
jgi:hypothetical protein